MTMVGAGRADDRLDMVSLASPPREPVLVAVPVRVNGDQQSAASALPATTPTRQFACLVLAEVNLGKRDTLQRLLGAIARETTAGMKGAGPERPLLPFRQLQGVHYARFVLLEQPGKAPPLLAFCTNYDGPEGEGSCSERRAFKHHVAELVEHAAGGLEQVFDCCLGYRSGELASFIRRNQRRASTFFVGAPGRSRNQILWEAALRREVDSILDTGNFAAESPDAVRSVVLERLKTKYPSIPSFPPQPDLSWYVTLADGLVAAALLAPLAAATWRFHLAGFGLIVLAMSLAVWRFRHQEQTDAQFQPEFSQASVARFNDAARDENEFLQNQLTHLVCIKPGLLRWSLIRVVFALLQVRARYQYNRGKLGDIPSIHFARWVLIPRRGVLFFSNFDSSWQSYLGDFIDKASSGLTAVWSNTVGYPRTHWLLEAGSQDAARFLAWTREHQRPTQVWYCAYPGLSMQNVNANTEIRRGLASPSTIDPTSWLFRLRGVDSVAADQLFGDERREPPLPVKDIQGIILWGYGHMPEARYLLFRVARPGPELRAWLGRLPLTSAEGSAIAEPPEPLVNVAFSYRGLVALGIDEALCNRFSTAFVQGSDHPYRARVNGDVGQDAPEHWSWGSAHNPVHLVLLVYAKDEPSVLRFARHYTDEARSHGLELVLTLEGTTLRDRKEHFGFRDGIAQPAIQGSGRGEIEGNTIAPGEIFLGHRDGYGNVSHSPESSAGFAFGRNASYLVFRQLEQDVEAFWRYCATQDPADPISIASKLVGRWPSGASLVRHPDKDPEQPRFADEDSFTYLENDDDNDRYGARCPFGAHIRRANPRDWQLGATPPESLGLANLHRILRRGRPYGPPLDASMSARSLVVGSTASFEGVAQQASRGLQFLCFNANIDRQFEFIQQQWCNNPKFAGQNSDADPLLGMRQAASEVGTDAPGFTLQTDVKSGLRPRATQLQRFVRVVGSSYFLMPSIPAVRLLRHAICVDSRARALERIPPDEQLHIDSLVAALRSKMKRDYAGGQTLRDAHPKMHGCVRAVLRVEPDLDESCKVGLFAEPKTYQAWVRFSNAAGKVGSDRQRDIRGVAIKLLGVPGPKLLEGAEEVATHDLVLISTDAFVARDVAEFDGLVQAMVRGGLSLATHLALHPRVAYRLLRASKRHACVTETSYFSVTPYLFGAHAVKYTLKPAEARRSAIPQGANPHYLRDALKLRLGAGSVRFELMIERQRDAEQHPIEDASRRWQGADSVRVATLEIHQQSFDSAERQAFGEDLSFNPWRCLPEHRPLGGINRARRQVYRALSSYRHDRNAAPSEEPESG